MANKKTTNKGRRAPAKAKKIATVATGKRRETPRESGPRGWFLPVVESTYTDLRPREVEGERSLKTTAVPEGSTYRSMLQPGLGEEVLRPADQNFWLDRLTEFKRRKAQVAARIPTAATRGLAPPAPSVPGGINWAPLGPSVVLNGQAEGEPPVAGRIPGIAVAPGGMIVYAASANGGVFRSDDGGVTWRSLMDAFDLAPTNFASTSLACGAIAIDRND